MQNALPSLAVDISKLLVERRFISQQLMQDEEMQTLVLLILLSAIGNSNQATVLIVYLVFIVLIIFSSCKMRNCNGLLSSQPQELHSSSLNWYLTEFWRCCRTPQQPLHPKSFIKGWREFSFRRAPMVHILWTVEPKFLTRKVTLFP